MRALAILVLATATAAAGPKPPADPLAALPAQPIGKLVVGTLPGDGQFAPFVMKSADGSWTGISIDLWKEIARRLRLDYELRELTIADLRDPAKMAALDAFVSLNVSAEREAVMDFSHAFYSTGNAIAVAPKDQSGLGTMLKAIFTPRFAKLIAALFAVLFVIGVLMWLAERRRNDQFGGKAVEGIGHGLWWSAVTMTTVGYGDKSPITFLGRVLGLFWMFAAILIISSFTASIASALTVSSLESTVSGPGDLPKVKCGSKDGSQGERYLTQRRIAHRTFATTAEEVDALAKGEVDAVVDEAPLLQYEVKKRGGDAGLVVLDGTFDNHGYALVLKKDSPIRKAVNIAMLQYIASDDWQALLARYLQ